MVFRRVITALVSFLAVGAASIAEASHLSADRYDVYYGDIDDNGQQDIYFHGKDRFVLLHGDIVTPIKINEPSFVVYQNSAGYSAPQALTLSDAQLAPLTLAVNDDDYFLADFDDDTHLDALVRGATGSDPALILTGTAGRALPVILVEYTGADALEHHSLSDRSLTLAVADSNNDGRLDIILVGAGSNGGDINYLADAGGVPRQFAGVLPGVIQAAPVPAAVPSVDQALIDGSDDVGAIAGQFRVDESGSATYTIPIATLAGTAGVAPQISLNYSSQTGNGLLGKGWSLGGLSAITRCRQTLQQDGMAAPITWSDGDRFCLDGKRLLLTSAGAYGSVGSTYKTEIDSFAKITAIGGTAGDPDHFKVERKDGSVSYYGATVDASLDIEAGTTYSWALKQFNDSVGNPIVFDYLNDVDGHRISAIYYAYGQTVATATYTPAGTSTTRLVFDYDLQDRPDIIGGYVTGHKLTVRKRLKAIQSVNEGVTVRQYNLTYENLPTGNAANKTSRLASVQECRTGNSDCLPAITTFDWHTPIPGISSDPSMSFRVAVGGKTHLAGFEMADINGDGKLDMVWLDRFVPTGSNDQDHYLKYAVSDGTSMVRQSFASGAQHYKYGENANETILMKVIDYNADGRQDIMVWSLRAAKWELYLSVPDGQGGWKLSRRSDITFPFNSLNIALIDINSDGLIDAWDGTNVFYLQRDPSQAASSATAYHFSSAEPLAIDPSNWMYFDDVRPVRGAGDINGDGREDILFYGQYQDIGPTEEPITAYLYGIQVSTVNANGELEYRILNRDTFPDQYDELPIAASGYIVFGDINADGLSDVLNFDQQHGEWRLFLSDGETLVPQGAVVSAAGLSAAREQALQLIDYNQDGYLDVVWHDRAQRKLMVRHWDPETESLATAVDIQWHYNGVSLPLYTSLDATVQNLLVDWTGDGVVDYVRYQDETFTFYPNTGTGPRDIITTISNGLGVDTHIEFEALNQTDHYARADITVTGSEVCFPNIYGPGNLCYPIFSSDYSYFNDPFAYLPPDAHSLQVEDVAPVLEFNGPAYVVTRVTSSAPTAADPNAQSAISYAYAEAKIQASGRGFLGFRKVRSIDEQTGVDTVTTYRQDWPFIGYPLETLVMTGAGEVLSQAENTWALKGFQNTWADTVAANGSAALGALKPYLAGSVEITYGTVTNLSLPDKLSVSTTPVQTVATTNTYDDYGNPVTILVETSGGGDTFTKLTSNEYGLTQYDREKGRLSKTSVVNTRNGISQPARVSAFNYYTTGAKKGLLKEEIIEPDNNQFKLTTRYEYNDFGNKIKVTQSGAGVTARATEFIYDAGNRYIDQTKNALGQITEQVVSRNSYGAPTRMLDIDGIATDIYYSALGREYLRYSPTGAYTQSLSALCNGCDNVANARYKVTSTQAGGSKVTTYFDALGREVQSRTLQFDGSVSYQNTEYDSLGRVARVSQPSSSATPGYWTENTYDILGRVVEMTLPDASVNTVHYNGLTTIYTNDKLQTKTETKNIYGELTQVVDNHAGTIGYTYLPQGELERVQVSAGTDGTAIGVPSTITTTFTYDLLGRKTSMSDPDKGDWEYDYNVFGELIEQRDANGQRTILTYDQLGRQSTRVDRRSNNSIEGSATWTYNNGTTGTGRGQVDQVADSVSGYVKGITYDTYGRVSETVTSLGQNAADGVHFEKVTYDQFGRTFQIFDAARDGSDYDENAIEHRYNAYGYLSAVVDAAYVGGNPRTTYYQVLAMDARVNVTEERLGNGHTTRHNFDPATGRLTRTEADLLSGLNTLQDVTYDWDTLGNLTRRHNRSGTKNIEETFLYDGLNRLTQTQVTGGDRTTVTYDAFGNIETKNTYRSDSTLNTHASVGTYSYGAGTAGDHAVTGTTIGNKTYSYDSNGNMTGDSDGRSITYSTFDKPLSISKGSHTTRFQYGPDRARYKRVDDANGEVTSTLYIGSVEKITRPDGSKEVKRYLNGVAIITLNYESDNQFSNAQEMYLYKDHLGSIDIITDKVGSIVQEMSFDAWGKRRAAVDWTALTAGELVLFPHTNTTRGFTGHEMLDEVGLVHMNGRIYDPHLGRFVQADPFIDGVSITQGYNRYSYVHNNPLNATDPTGHFAVTLFAAIVLAAEAAVWYVAGAALFAAQLVESLVQGASFGDALKAGIISGISGAAFSAIDTSAWDFIGGSELLTQSLAFGVVGGITSTLQGGKFGHGFISAGVGGCSEVP
ncbi:hypothetical protein FKG94_20905 [Exilibacterium tricleocarpae]|uniref:Teneurin-like YD-shell domain-containing protein n=1 Tax=Exilibacterium tricleocarpae TaxID=2591008 RepID=A0A545T0N4_9GAMM|nr:RHS repeat-associated core domain-containing protein [Exilibacterium tricleocarpae]TQV70787.1 hypothetical protein FKG94_20905 [Exilibacterium tricleocarpae]